MKSDVVQLVLALLALVTGAALEELLPKALGVGFPLLLAAAVYAGARRRAAFALAFAAAAGAAEDALSALPLATSVSFFPLAAVAAMRLGRAVPVALVAYPCYQLWLWVWLADLNGSVFLRVLASVPVMALTAWAAFAALARAERGAAADDD